MSLKSRSPIGLISVFCVGALVGAAVAIGESADRRARTDLRATPPPPQRNPGQLSLTAWRAAAVGSLQQFGRDRIPAAAAGVTFYILLALFPAISAFVSLYGLVSDVSDAQQRIHALEGLAPAGALSVISEDLTRLTQTGHDTLSLAFAISLVISIWSANAGMKALIDALNVAYEAAEKRRFVRLTLVSLGFTIGAIAAVSFAVAAPTVASRLGLQTDAFAAWLRWPLMLAAVILAFSLLYRFGPCRPGAGWAWITPGGVLAALAWMIMSGLFSWYVANFGHYNRTYGSLGAIVGFLTWVWLSLMVLLLGAEFNREIERRAAR
jgi:membrane protein